MEQVRDTIAAFTGSLAAEAGRFREGHTEDAHRVAAQMRALREHVASELSALAAKNHACQMQALKPRAPKGIESLLTPGVVDGSFADPFTGLGGAEASQDALSPDTAMPDELREVVVTGGRQRRRSVMEMQNLLTKQLQARQPVTLSDGMYQKLEEVASRDDVFVLQLKVKELGEKQVLTRMFHHFKCQTMRQKFEEQVHALQMTLESNTELLDQLAEVYQDERVGAAQFKDTAKTVTTIEKRNDELRAVVDVNTEQRRRLEKWRKNKIKQLVHMQQSVREHQVAGTVDVASLLEQIQEKSELVHELERQREESERFVEEAFQRSSSLTKQVKTALKDQRQVKDSTFKDLQYSRGEVQNGGTTEAERLELWQSRQEEAQQRVEDLEEENHRLRILLDCSQG